MLKITTSEELYNRGEVDDFEYHGSKHFYNKTIIKFDSLREAVVFTVDFVGRYLIPKYGREEAAKFPMTKTHPLGYATEVLTEIVLGTEKNNQETWLVVPNNRFNEVGAYLNLLDQGKMFHLLLK